MSEYILEATDGWKPVECTEEIVRCRDCQYEMNGECTRIDEWIDELWFPVEPDGFCKWGERKDND